jgi:hypothetical protein
MNETSSVGAADARREVPLEVNNRLDVHAGMGPAAPHSPAELVALPLELVGTACRAGGVGCPRGEPAQPLPPPATARGEGG